MVLPDVIPPPEADKYVKISISKALQISDAIKRQLSGEGASGDETIEGLRKAKNVYRDTKQFCDIMNAFVENEKDENEAMEKKQRFSGINPSWISSTLCSFKAPPALYRSVSLGSQIKFTQTIDGNEVCETAKIVRRNKNMTVDAKFNEPSKFEKSRGTLTVFVVFNSIIYERQKAALAAFSSERKPMDSFIVDCILGKPERFNENNRIKGIEPKIPELPPKYFKKLNPSQELAIKRSLTQHFTLLQGPPGTGKTTTIAALALAFVRNGISPVLVCAQSNVATDFATLRVAQTGVSVARVLSSTREEVAGDIDKYTTKELAKARFGEEWEKVASEKDEASRKAITKMEIEVVRSSDVVCTTCMSAGGARLTGRIKFQAVIFDESGQCLDPDLLIPLVHGCRQCVLVGDHKQLGPVVVSRKAQRARYDLPLMQRLIINGIHPLVLRTQYRMHPALSAFPSEAFYSGMLQDGVLAEHRTWPKKFINWPNPQIPLIFWNIKSQEEFYESGLSYVNRHEVGAVALILEAMYKADIKASDVGVITPYAGQQAYLIETLPTICANIKNKAFFDDVEIASVDAFQGREKNFIILSNVRANDQHDLGFVKDLHRLCVSLTRARYGLIVIGCADTFSENKVWCQFIKHCQDRNVFVEGAINNFKPSSFTPQVDLEKGDNDGEDDNQDDADEGIY
jgi:regulator of nonsense transcripts 1